MWGGFFIILLNAPLDDSVVKDFVVLGLDERVLSDLVLPFVWLAAFLYVEQSSLSGLGLLEILIDGVEKWAVC